MGAVAPQNFFDLPSLVGYIGEGAIHFVDEQNDLDGRSGARQGIKRRDLLRLFVVQKREILLMETWDWLSRFVAYHYIESDEGTCFGERKAE